MLKISWPHFYSQFKSDLRLWCYCVVIEQICRLSFIYTLSNYLAQTTQVSTIIQAMIHGLRFDSLWATVFIFIPLLLITIPSIFVIINNKYPNYFTYTSYKFRYYLGGLFTIITVLIYIISIEYFREYKDLFNQFLFNFFYDDQIAILKTIWAEHHVLLYAIVLIATLILYKKYLHKFIILASNKNTTEYSNWKKTTLTICIVLFYIIGFRGSIGPRPIQLKDAGVTRDTFLNKAIISPYSTLKYAIREQLTIHTQDNYRYTSNSQQDIKELAKAFFHTNIEHERLSEYMHKIAPGTLLPKPKHVFLIIGESLDSWPIQAKYNKFKLTPNLHKLIKKGLHLKYFLPCANGTMATINTIITGFPDLDLHTNYQPNSYQAYPTALAKQFKNLGFKTQFFYGGYLSWQRLEDFVKTQGSDTVYGAAHISNWKQTNEWGVDDRTLFNFIAKNIQTSNVPTFNVIMTTSNHPPFSINLQAESFKTNKISKLLAQYPNTTTNVKELGHIWYADKTIGEFITNITKQYPKALFAITGDHFGRRHILPNPPLFDVSAVPLILYGNNIKYYYKFPASVAGSHLDLGATLIELVAPKGFHYYALGANLLTSSNHTVGLGQQTIITRDFIASTTSQTIMYLRRNNYHINTNQLALCKQQYDQAMDIAWWMIKIGDHYEKNK